MRNLFPSRLEHIGTIQVGVKHYYAQRYFPNGGNNFCVYVFLKGSPEQRGMVFQTTADFQHWADNAPQQIPLF